MTVTTRWYDDEKRAVYCLFDGKWNWTELFEAFEASDELIASVNHPVRVIVDMHRTQHVPVLAPTALSKVASMSTNRPANAAGIIFFGARGFIKAMFDIFSRIHPKAAQEYQFAESQAELDALITQPIS